MPSASTVPTEADQLTPEGSSFAVAGEAVPVIWLLTVAENRTVCPGAIAADCGLTVMLMGNDV